MQKPILLKIKSMKCNEKFHLIQDRLSDYLPIDSLLSKADCDHIHLMTNEWGGNELSDKKQSPENELINHVKIFKWFNIDN